MTQYFKRLDSLLSEIYKEFPHMRRHPEYRFYYLHWGYPETREFFIVITNLIPDSPNDKFKVFVNLQAQVFGFVEGVLLKPEDFDKYVAKPITDSINEFRGSEFKTFGYEVW